MREREHDRRAQGAFLGEPSIKQKHIERVKAQHEAGKLVPLGSHDQRDIAAIERQLREELGVPSELHRVQNHIVKGLPENENRKFQLDFLSAIKPGVDLSTVHDTFMCWLPSDEKEGIIQYLDDEEHKDLLAAITETAESYEAERSGYETTVEQWWYVARDLDSLEGEEHFEWADMYAAYDGGWTKPAIRSWVGATWLGLADRIEVSMLDRPEGSELDEKFPEPQRQFHYRKLAGKLISLLKEAQ